MLQTCKGGHQANAVSGLGQGNNLSTNSSLDQLHMLKGKQSYRREFTHNLKKQREPRPNSKGHRDPLPPCFKCAKLAIALLCASSKKPSVINVEN